MQSHEEELPIDVKEEEEYILATADRPKPPTKGGDKVLEVAPPSPEPQHALLRPQCELPSGEVAVQGRGRAPRAIVFGTDSHENPPPARPEPKWGPVNDLEWEMDATPPDLESRYGDDPPEGAGEAVGAVGGADSPPASFMAHASSPGMNQAVEEDSASRGVELQEDAAKQPADDEFFDIIRELEEESDATEDRPKPPTKGGDEVLEAAPPSPEPQHALLRPRYGLPSGEVPVQGPGRATRAIVFGTGTHDNPPPARPQPNCRGAVNHLGWEVDATPPDLESRYLDDPLEGGADSPPANPKYWESYFGIKIRWDTIPANESEGDLASLGAEVPEDAAEQPVNGQEGPSSEAPASGLGDRSLGAVEEGMAGARDVDIHGRDIGEESEDTERLTDHGSCRACHYHEREVILNPCGHRDLCKVCFWRDVAQVRPVRCPTCKMMVKYHEYI